MPLVNYNTPGGSLQTGCTDSIATEDINHIAQTQQQQQQPNQNNNDDQSTIPNNTTQQTEEVEDDDDDADPLFSCQCDSARTIATLLSCLRRVITAGNNGTSFNSSHTQGGATQTQRGGTQSAAISGASANKIQHATVYAGPNGLTFHVQHGLAKQSQCSVDLPKNMFKEYFVGEEEVWLEDSDDEDGNNNGNNNSSQQTGKTKEIIQGGEFGVNLTTVLECFSILSKTGSKPSSATTSTAGGGHSGKGNSSKHLGEYASLSNVPLCMSYDRGTATFHLEFLEGGSLATSGGDAYAAANMGGGGCLVTCEVPGVEVSDDVDAGPDNEGDQGSSGGGNSGLAAAFRSSPLLCRAILYSDALHSAVNELYDVPGANIVQVSLSNKGIELGTVGPRSECWVSVPYNRGQGGMYVGLECYKPNVPLFGVNATLSSASGDGKNIVRRYSLSAFLSGMRGLDIGVETCISVNARGMMAIQHQVDRDGYYNYSEDGGGGKPSFVDFIMTCIEDEVEEGDGASQEDASVRMDHQHSGLNDVTNTASTDNMEDVASRRSKSTRGRATTGKEDSSSDEEEEERPTRKGGRKGKKRNDAESEFGGDGGGEVEYGSEDEQEKRKANKKNDATSRLLGELEVDSDMLSSRRGGATKATTAVQGRKNALEDIRRRRQERQKESAEKPDDEEDEDDDTTTNNGRKSSDSNNSRKRRSETSKARSSRKTRRSEEADEDNNRHRLARDSQESQSEDDGEETENELDVTAEIPQLFSKRSSLSTSRHSSRGSNFRTTASMDNDESDEEEQEPRMHYGDTKLEFTQDSDSD